MIRPVQSSDAHSIATIYNYYIRETTVTFEEAEITEQEMLKRINKVGSFKLPWLVAEHSNSLLGFAYATRWKERSAYRNTVEISVYIDHEFKGKGWGSKLYKALFAELRQLNIHLAIGGITLPNKVSIALHEKFGMKKVAHFEEIGYKFNEWRDVAYWQKKLQ